MLALARDAADASETDVGTLAGDDGPAPVEVSVLAQPARITETVIRLIRIGFPAGLYANLDHYGRVAAGPLPRLTEERKGRLLRRPSEFPGGTPGRLWHHPNHGLLGRVDPSLGGMKPLRPTGAHPARKVPAARVVTVTARSGPSSPIVVESERLRRRM